MDMINEKKAAAELQLFAKTEYLDKVLTFLDNHLDANGCDEQAKLELDIAVEELFVNVASYAYHSGNGPITIQITFEGDLVTIVLIDEGIPYNPWEREDPDITLSAEERQIGGLGVYMVKMSMDHVDYVYKDNKNILTIQKKIHEA